MLNIHMLTVPALLGLLYFLSLSKTISAVSDGVALRFRILDVNRKQVAPAGNCLHYEISMEVGDFLHRVAAVVKYIQLCGHERIDNGEPLFLLLWLLRGFLCLLFAFPPPPSLSLSLSFSLPPLPFLSLSLLLLFVFFFESFFLLFRPLFFTRSYVKTNVFIHTQRVQGQSGVTDTRARAYTERKRQSLSYIVSL